MSRRNRGRADGALVTNASDPAQVREAERAETEERRQQLADLRAVLATPAGARFVWRLLERCRLWKTSWDPSARIHFNEGERNIGLFLVAELEAADPGALYEMHKTVNQQRAREADARVAERLRQREDDDDDDQ